MAGWSITGPSAPEPDTPEGGDYAIRDEAGKIIAEVYRRVDYGDAGLRDARGNARLIAAAPDLLESLEWYIGMSKRMGNASIAGDSQAILTLMKEFAVDYGGRGRAAIAKAKGESNG